MKLTRSACTEDAIRADPQAILFNRSAIAPAPPE
jgi:hypothetical protein